MNCICNFSTTGIHLEYCPANKKINLNEKDLIIIAINTLKLWCNENATAHGFWSDEDQLLDQAENEYNKKLVLTLFNSQKIALEMSELAERLETLRKDPTKKDEHCPEFFNVEIECADLIIRCLDFCGRRNLRIGEAIMAKMEYNKSRPYKHDKNF